MIASITQFKSQQVSRMVPVFKEIIILGEKANRDTADSTTLDTSKHLNGPL